MSARCTQEDVLPEVRERRRIMEHAGIVLAEARSLLQRLDRTGGRLNVLSVEVPDQKRGLIISFAQPSAQTKPDHWS